MLRMGERTVFVYFLPFKEGSLCQQTVARGAGLGPQADQIDDGGNNAVDCRVSAKAWTAQGNTSYGPSAILGSTPMSAVHAWVS
jgi:hypothetical protein